MLDGTDWLSQIEGADLTQPPAPDPIGAVLASVGDIAPASGTGLIEGVVWADADGNAIQDDVYVHDFSTWTVELDHDNDGIAESSTSPDTAGYYRFDSLGPGDYWVRVVPWDPNWVQSYPGTPTVGGEMPHQVTVTDGSHITDFGYVPPGEISGTVWADADGNALQDDAYPYDFSMWTVELDQNQDGTVDRFTSPDSSGFYRFDGLVPGDYWVTVMPADPNWVQSWPGTPVVGGEMPHSVTVMNGWHLADFGYVPPGEIFGTVWADANGDGLQGDAYPYDFSMWTVELDQNQDGSVDRFTSPDPSGFYSFDGLVPGDYWVTVMPADPNWVQSWPGTPVVGGEMPHSVTVMNGWHLANFGYVPPGEISGTVWADANGNALQDDAYPYDFSMWTVELDQNQDGSVDRFTSPDPSGFYSFDGLVPGDYWVTVMPADPNWVQSTPGTPTVGGEMPHSVTVMNGWHSADFGYVPPGEISGTVWADANGNAIQDDAYPYDFSMWTVELDQNQDGSVDRFTSPDPSGLYRFDGLVPGDYWVTVMPADLNWVQSWPGTPTVGGEMPHSVTVMNGWHLADFGYVPPGEIYGVVWADENGNALHDDAYVYDFSTWIVELDQNGDGLAEYFTSPDVAGYYRFEGLVPGDYEVSVVADANWVQSYPGTPTVGGELPHYVTVMNGLHEANFGYVPPGEIYGVVWADENGNALHDDAYVYDFSTWIVELDQNGDGLAEYFTSPDVAGYYRFEGLVPGDYEVSVVAEANWVQSYPGTPRVGGELPHYVTVMNGLHEANFGYVPPGEIYGVVWADENGNALHDDAYMYDFSTWTVELDQNGDGLAEYFASPDVAGYYRFEGLVPGDYEVSVVAEANWVQSHPGVPTVGGEMPHYVTVMNGLHEANFGYVPPGEIYGTVWADANGNTLQDDAYPYDFTAWTIELDQDGDGIAEYLTWPDVAGYYRFEGLVPGDYEVSVVAEANWVQSYPGTPTVGGEMPHYVTVMNGLHEANFGYVPPGEIYGVVWADENGNGLQDDAYVHDFTAWTIELDQNRDGTVDRSTSPDASGYYQFDALVPGDYAVREVLEPNWVQTYPGTGTVGGDLPHDITVMGSSHEANFGNQRTAEIHGHKWSDLNGDGVWDAGEPGLEGWTIYLDEDGDDVLDAGEESTLTASDGSYAFTGLVSGTYAVVEVAQAGWQQTFPVGASGPVAWWPFDGGPGTTAADASGNEHTGSLTGATLTAFGALSLDGDDDIVEVVDAPDLHITSEITMAAWVNPSELRTNGVILWKRDDTVGGPMTDCYGLILDHLGATGEIMFMFGPNSYETTAGFGLTTGTWTHVAATFDDDTDQLTFYKNGALHEVISTSRTIFDSSDPLAIGAHRADDGSIVSEFAGLIDEVRILDYPLSPEEIAGEASVNGAHRVSLSPGATAPDVDFGNQELAQIHGHKWNDLDGDGEWDLGEEADSASSGGAISADGRYVAFASSAGNLVTSDANGHDDIFVRDRWTGVTVRVSVSSAGVEADSGSYDPAISGDGRYVAFVSSASNLVAGDTNGADDVFVHDRQTGGTTRVSVSSASNEGDGGSFNPSVSADGRWVAFQSNATNLVSGDTNGAEDVFVHDRQTGETTRVSVSSTGDQGNGRSYDSESISGDGRYVAFISHASNLVSDDTNGHGDVFVHDRQTGETTRVSVSTAGDEANADSSSPSVSADGQSVAFRSSASNLVADDTNGHEDVFVHDRQTGETSRASVSSVGDEGDAGSFNPNISADARFVAFTSHASNLSPGDTNSVEDAFLHDRQTGETTRISVSSTGGDLDSRTYNRAISSDGGYVVLQSWASNLVANDTNGSTDVFVYNRLTGETSRESLSSGEPVLSGWTIYLDDNGNGQLDAGEMSVVTDADGAYAFTDLVPGEYTVAEVQDVGWRQTAPAESDPGYAWTATAGGGSEDSASEVTIDPQGNVYMVGYFGYSSGGTVDFDPTDGTDEYTSSGSADAFISKFGPDGAYGWTMTMGGGSEARATCAATDASGNLLVGGYFLGTADLDPTDGVENHTSSGHADGFVVKLNSDDTFAWARTFGASDRDYGPNDIATDSAGNVYIAGSFYGTVDFDPTGDTDDHTSNGDLDIYVTKLNADGSYGWTRSVGGGAGDNPDGVAVDSADNVLVTGFFSNTVDFDPTGSGDARGSSGDWDVFVMKLSPTNGYLWTQTIGGAGQDNGRSISVDPAGRPVITGNFSGTVDFDPAGDSDIHASNGGVDVFVTKLNGDGTYGWTRTVGGTHSEGGEAVCVSPAGKVYVASGFDGTVDFDPSPATDSHTSNGQNDIFVMGLNADGSYAGSWTVGGGGDEGGYGVATDSAGNLCVTGRFQTTVDFDPTGDADTHASNGGSDFFLTKLLIGAHSLDLAAGEVLRDVDFGNQDAVAPTLWGWHVDEDRGASSSDKLTNDTTPVLTFTFSEPVTGADSDVIVLDPSAGVVTPDAIYGWGTHTLTVQFTTPLAMDGEYTVTLNGSDTIADAVGNPLNAVGNPLNDGADEVLHFTLETVPPTVTDMTPGPGSSSTGPVDQVQATFSEDVDDSVFSMPEFVEVPIGEVDARVLVDLDGDGDLDMVGAVSSGTGMEAELWVWWYDGTYLGMPIATGLYSDHMAGVTFDAADVDGDGDVDLLGLAGSYSSDLELRLWRNDGGQSGDGQFGQVTLSSDATEDYRLVDLEGDGDLDIVGVVSNDPEYGLRVWQYSEGAYVGQTLTMDMYYTYPGSADGGADYRIADMDGDGDLDILGLIGYSSDLDLVLWTNNGDTFAEELLITDATSDYQTPDLDADGDLDIVGVVYESSSYELGVWLNDGVFSGTILATDVYYPHSVSDGGAFDLADTDGDSDLDILGRTGDAGDPDLTLWHNHGGAFGGATLVSVANLDYQLVDLEGDGDLDVVGVAHGPSGYELDVWTNDAGTYSAQILTTQVHEYYDYSGPSSTLRFAYETVDADGDGDIDVVGLSDEVHDSELRWWRNDDGAFAQGCLGANVSWDFRLVDLESDGDVDILGVVSTDPGTGELWAWVFDGGYSGRAVVHGLDHDPIHGAVGEDSYTAVDVDGDGDLDLVGQANQAGSSSGSGLCFWWNEGGAFSQQWLVGTSDSYGFYVDYRLVDLESDGDFDVLAVVSSGSSYDDAYLWAGLYDHGGYTGQTVATGVYCNYHASPGEIDTDYDAADVDGDGDLDLVVGYGGTSPGDSGDLRLWRQEDARLRPTTFSEVSIGSASERTLADLDGDGDLDVVGVVPSAYGSEADLWVWWYDGNYAGLPIAGGLDYDSMYGEVEYHVADVDDDGDLDIVGSVGDSSSTGHELWFWRNDGGVFREIMLATSVGGEIRVVDLEGDGDLDILAPVSVGTGSMDYDLWAWVYDHGYTGRAIASGIYYSAYYDYDYAAYEAVDVDGDGDLDIVGTVDSDGGMAGELRLWRNNGDTFGVAVITTDLSGDRRLVDLDRDGDLDVLGVVYNNMADVYDLWAWTYDDGYVGQALVEGIYYDSMEGRAEYALADLNGDGDLDILGVREDYMTYDLIAWVHDGAGYQPYQIVSGLYNVYEGAQYEAGDVDGDGDLDVFAVTGDYSDCSLGFWRNEGGSFHQSILSSQATTQFELVDLDSDEDLDVLAVISTDSYSTTYDLWAWEYDLGYTGRVIAPNIYYSTYDYGGADYEAADVDGDGDLDIVGRSGDSMTSSLCFWRNEDGAFTVQSFGSAMAYSLVDLESDGDLDILAVSSSDPYSYDGYLWAGWYEDGGYVRQTVGTDVSYDSMYGGADYEVADVDGDGDLDIVVNHGGDTGYGDSGDLRLWRQDNAFLVSPELTEHPIGPAEAQSLVDLDGDGDLDVVGLMRTDSPGYELWVWWNHGNYTGRPIAAGLDYASHHDGVPYQTADVDGDGDVDIVGLAQGAEGDELRLWRNDGGQFVEEIVSPRVTEDFRLVDMDGDGDLDLVGVLAGDAYELGVWLYDGGYAGGVVASDIHTYYDDAVRRGAFDVADIDADNDLDILGLAGASDALELRVWHNNGGAFVQDVVASAATRDYRLVDLDGDGDLDVLGVVSNASDTYDLGAWWYDGGYTGGVIVTEIYRYSDGAVDRGAFDAADIDGDNDVDIVGTAGDPENREFRLWRNNGGAFGEEVLLAGSVRGVEILDLEGDGDLDIVGAVSSGSGSYDLILWLYDAGGHTAQRLAAGLYQYTDYSGPATTRFAYKTGDVEGDGDVDVVAVVDGASSRELRWWRNDGATFAENALGVDATEDFRLVDLDSDSDLDILSAVELDYNTRDVWAWVYDGRYRGGPVAGGLYHDSAMSSTDYQAADVDGDGDLDIVGAKGDHMYGDTTVSFWRNDGGMFSERQLGSGTTYSLLDLDLDGDLDVLGLSSSDPHGSDSSLWAGWYSDGGYTRQTVGSDIYHDAMYGGASYNVADVDGDGDLDFLTADGDSYYQGNLRLWRQDCVPVSLIEAGADGTFGTADDVGVVPSTLEYDAATQTVVLGLDEPLEPGTYQLTLADRITDMAGNALDGDGNYSEPPVDAFPSGDGSAGGDFAGVYGITMVPSEIHGSVWNDLNGNGVRDAGEPPLTGWTVYLDTDANGALDPGEPSTLTDGSGDYLFTDLPPDDYLVREALEPNWAQTSPGAPVPEGDQPHSVCATGGLYQADFGNWLWTPVSAALGLNRTTWLTGGPDVYEFRAHLEGEDISSAHFTTPSGEHIDLVEASPGAFGFAFAGDEATVAARFLDGQYEMVVALDSGLTLASSALLTGDFPVFPDVTGPLNASWVNTLQPDLTWTQWQATDEPARDVWVEIEDAVSGEVLYPGRTAPLADDATEFQVPAGVLREGPTEAELDFSQVSGVGAQGWPIVGKGSETIWHFSVDTDAPVVTVDELITHDRTPALSGTVDDPTATVEVTVNGVPYAAVNSGGSWTVADDAIATPLPYGVHNVQARATDQANNVGTDSTTDELAVMPLTFQVIDLAVTPSGVDVAFNREVDVDTLDLYDGQDASLDIPDLTLVGDVVGAVDGSLVWDAGTDTLRFIQTGGLLEPDDYELTLFSRPDGFVDAAGELLDGDADGAAGGDYVAEFTVPSTTARVITLPDFARGPGQTIDVPATGTGLPVSIDDGDGVQSVDLAVVYDPMLATVLDVTLAVGMPADWQVESAVAAGTLNVTAYGVDPLPPGSRELFSIIGQVALSAPYGATQILRLEGVQLNEEAIEAQGDQALHVVAYVGDASGNGEYSGLDASYIARVAVGHDTGFDAYDLIDPLILGDVTGNGALSGLDASYVAGMAAGRDVPEIPDVPVPAGPAGAAVGAAGDLPGAMAMASAEDAAPDTDAMSALPARAAAPAQDAAPQAPATEAGVGRDLDSPAASPTPDLGLSMVAEAAATPSTDSEGAPAPEDDGVGSSDEGEQQEVTGRSLAADRDGEAEPDLPTAGSSLAIVMDADDSAAIEPEALPGMAQALEASRLNLTDKTTDSPDLVKANGLAQDEFGNIILLL